MIRGFLVLTLLLLPASAFTSLILVAPANSPTTSGNLRPAPLISTGTILVPDNYAGIQLAIDNANEGDTIIVKAGTYYENLVVNKSISLVGEGSDKTIINGQGKETAVYVTAGKVSISGFSVRNCSIGIWFFKADNGTVRQDVVKNISYGIKLDYSKNMVLSENTVEDSKWFGIVLNRSGNSTLRNNHLSGTRYNLRVDGLSLEDFLNDIDTSNTVNNMPVYYLKNRRNMIIDSSTLRSIGYLALINSTNITIRNLNLEYNGQGILLAFTNNSVINKVTATGNWNGIQVEYSSNVTVSDSDTSSNGDFGVKFEHSTHGTITGNKANGNGWAGIGVFTSTNFRVANNIADNNIYGIDLVYSRSNLVTLNNADNTRDKYSIAVYYSNSNLICQNNFVNYLIFKDQNNYFKNNTWDNSLEGNYWATYNGQDSDQDGIGDTLYRLEEGNQDNHPLMGKFSVFSINPQHNITIISNSMIANFRYDSQNRKISFDAIGKNNTQGFTRLRLPKALIDEPYTIVVNGKEPSTMKQLPESNDTYQYVYITYINSPAPNTEIALMYWQISILLMIAVFVLVSVFFMSRSAKHKMSKYKSVRKAA